MFTLIVALVCIVISGTLGWVLASRYQYKYSSSISFSRVREDAELTAAMNDSERLALYQKILDTIDSAILVHDTSGKVISFNDAWRKLDGKTDGQLYLSRDRWGSLFRLPDSTLSASSPEDPVSLALLGHKEKRRWNFVHGDSSKPVFVSTYPLRDPQEKQTGVISVVQEFTKIQDVERELERERALLDSIIKVLPDAFVFRDMSGKAVLFNDAIRQCRPDIDVARFKEGPKEDDLVEAASGEKLSSGQSPMSRALNGEVVISEELQMLQADGTKIDVLVTSIPVRDDENIQYGAFSITRDIAVLKKRSAMRTKDGRSRALGTLAAGIAHDFNNQLGTILGNVQLALSTLKEQEEVRGYLECIARSTQSGAQLTQGLMALGDIVPGEQHDLNVRELFRNFLPAIKSVFEAYVCLTVSDIDSTLSVRCNQAQLESALLNLLLNAKEATQSTSKPSVSIIISQLSIQEAKGRGLPTAHPYLSIAVEDNGIGFSKEAYDEAFDPFFTTKAVSEGAGLGLTMVDGFVRQHGGQVTLTSDKPGLTRVELILLSGAAMPSQPMEDDSRSAIVPGHHETVLVVEDRPELLEVTREMLSLLNYDVITAENAVEGLRYFDEDSSIDLVIADVMLGEGMNGVEMMEQVHQRRPGVNVIYTSGGAGSRNDISLPPQHSLLRKPVTLEMLSSAVSDSLTHPAA